MCAVCVFSWTDMNSCCLLYCWLKCATKWPIHLSLVTALHTTNLNSKKPKCQTLAVRTSPRLPQWGGVAFPLMWEAQLRPHPCVVYTSLTLLTVSYSFSSLFYHDMTIILSYESVLISTVQPINSTVKCVSWESAAVDHYTPTTSNATHTCGTYGD